MKRITRIAEAIGDQEALRIATRCDQIADADLSQFNVVEDPRKLWRLDLKEFAGIIARYRDSLYPDTVTIDLEAAKRVEQSLAAGGLLKPGAAVFTVAQKQADGVLTTARVTAEKNGVKPPM